MINKQAVVCAEVSKGGQFVLIYDKARTNVTEKMLNDQLRSMIGASGKAFFLANLVDGHWHLVPSHVVGW